MNVQAAMRALFQSSLISFLFLPLKWCFGNMIVKWLSLFYESLRPHHMKFSVLCWDSFTFWKLRGTIYNASCVVNTQLKILKCKKLCDHPNCVEQGKCCNHHVNISADFYLLWNWLPKPGSEKEQLPHWDAEISCITNIVSKNIYVNEPSRFLCLVDIYSTETEALTWEEAVGG